MIAREIANFQVCIAEAKEILTVRSMHCCCLISHSYPCLKDATTINLDGGISAIRGIFAVIWGYPDVVTLGLQRIRQQQRDHWVRMIAIRVEL
jgi:hypothetical protein